LVNHFYVNPYAATPTKNLLETKENKINKKDTTETEEDVYFDSKKGKLVIGENKSKKQDKKEKFNKKRPRSPGDEKDKTNVKKLKDNQSGHIIKYSGDEYKSKKGKGDILVKGKADPFAYIQLNPKTTSRKNRKDGLNTFKSIMEKPKGSLMGGLKINKQKD
jgi:ribosomal RNA-processing protein 12